MSQKWKVRLINLAYVAGFIDADGTIGFYKLKGGSRRRRGFQYRAYVQIANDNKPCLIFSKAVLGTGYIYTYKGHHRLMIKSHKKLSKYILPVLMPFLIVKKMQAHLILKAISLLKVHKNHFTPNDSKLEVIYKQVSHLNGNKGGGFNG